MLKKTNKIFTYKMLQCYYCHRRSSNFAKFQNEIEPLHVTDNTSLNSNIVSHSQNRSAVRQIVIQQHFS